MPVVSPSIRYIYSHNPHMKDECKAAACANTYFGSILYMGFRVESPEKLSKTFKDPQYQFVSELQKDTPLADWNAL